MLSDIQIAQQTPCEPITEIAKKLNIDVDDLELYGKYKAKLPLSLNKKYADRENGKLKYPQKVRADTQFCASALLYPYDHPH